MVFWIPLRQLDDQKNGLPRRLFICAILSCFACHVILLIHPAQMLILTYEAASTDMLYPYFNHRFAPLKPIQIFGRYAKGEPEFKPSHAVWYAWKDRTLQST